MSEISYDVIEKEIVELYRSGLSPSQIGIKIREKYNINIKEKFNKKITDILQEKGIVLQYPEDFTYILRKIGKLLKHLEKNKKDIPARRCLERLESNIPRLVRYYKSIGRLPENFEYSRELAKMFAV